MEFVTQMSQSRRLIAHLRREVCQQVENPTILRADCEYAANKGDFK